MKAHFVVPAAHPALDGHFPGRPIVPAVVLLAEALAPLALERWSLASAKFLAPVAAGEPLTLHREEDGDRFRFEIRSGEALVATGVLARNP